ncbi:MAG: MerR family transcriptional regulator [Nitratireductor sp.]|jgi:DNA-binding transcriptional MerR regulator|nr:MerR family transcriptional regulator [Nitratireductor sp.]
MNKSPDAFRTISEVADDLDLPQHVLRFWETRFREIKPLKRGGGRRYYRPDDVDLLRGIKHLLYEEGYTIRGLQRILKEQGNRFVVAVGRGEVSADSAGGLPPAMAAKAAAATEPEFEEPQISTGDDEDGAEPVAETVPAATGRARTVGEITAPAKPRGFFDRLRGREPEADDDAAGERTLSAAERRSLQATLYELLECKRLLDQVRGT